MRSPAGQHAREERPHVCRKRRVAAEAGECVETANHDECQHEKAELGGPAWRGSRPSPSVRWRWVLSRTGSRGCLPPWWRPGGDDGGRWRGRGGGRRGRGHRRGGGGRTDGSLDVLPGVGLAGEGASPTWLTDRPVAVRRPRRRGLGDEIGLDPEHRRAAVQRHEPSGALRHVPTPTGGEEDRPHRQSDHPEDRDDERSGAPACARASAAKASALASAKSSAAGFRQDSCPRHRSSARGPIRRTGPLGSESASEVEMTAIARSVWGPSPSGTDHRWCGDLAEPLGRRPSPPVGLQHVDDHCGGVVTPTGRTSASAARASGGQFGRVSFGEHLRDPFVVEFVGETVTAESRSRSPTTGSSNQASTATTGSTPSARVSTFRCG